MYRAKTGDKIYESTAKFTHSRDRRGQRGAQEHFGEENLRQTPEMRARAIIFFFFLSFSQLYNFNIRSAILFFVVHAVNRGIFMFCFCLFLYRAGLSVFVRAACDGDL